MMKSKTEVPISVQLEKMKRDFGEIMRLYKIMLRQAKLEFFMLGFSVGILFYITVQLLRSMI